MFEDGTSVGLLPLVIFGLKGVGGGLHSTEVAYLLLTQKPRVRFPGFRGKIIIVAEVNQRRWLEDGGLKMLIKHI